MSVITVRIGELMALIVAAGRGDKWPAPDPDLSQWLAEVRRVKRAQWVVNVDEEDEEAW